MGQRSQIYIRYNVTYAYNEENVKNYKGLIARYFGWNYGERMVSRCRGIIERISGEYIDSYAFSDPSKIKKLARVCDVNFDMKDILLSADIIKEFYEFASSDPLYIFEQDNNDGQLFIDVKDNTIKYAFMQFYNKGEPMTAKQYMDWNNGEGWELKPTDYLCKEAIDYTLDNAKEIEAKATLMTAEEIKAFVEDVCKEYGAEEAKPKPVPMTIEEVVAFTKKVYDKSYEPDVAEAKKKAIKTKCSPTLVGEDLKQAREAARKLRRK